MTIRTVSSLLLAAAAVLPAGANKYFSTDFEYGFPSKTGFYMVDGGALRENIYKNIGNIGGEGGSPTWLVRALPDSHGNVAMSPTRRAEEGRAAENMMVFPCFSADNMDAVIMWEARSLHKHIPESYSVLVRQTAAGPDIEWTEVFRCDAESHQFTRHCASLAPWYGQIVEVAFLTHTVQGFMLAIDNVFAGVPEEHIYVFDNRTPKFVGNSDETHFAGTLTYFGPGSDLLQLGLVSGGPYQVMDLPQLKCGDSVEVDFAFTPTTNGPMTVTLDGIDTAYNYNPLFQTSVTVSDFPRTHVVDRFSGLWCNNCPMMELTTTRLENLYGEQLVVLESHVNDRLTNAAYRDTYFGESMFAIPALVANHDLANMEYSLAENDDYHHRLHSDTNVGIQAVAYRMADGTVRISADVEVAEMTDNSADNLRLAYMLTGDFHLPGNGYYNQSSSSGTVLNDYFYYQPDRILSEMMYYTNVPIEASVAYTGVARSLPATLSPASTYSHTHTLVPPADFGGTGMHALAMVKDIETGLILNAAFVEIQDGSGVDEIDIDNPSGPAEYYDISGRRVGRDARGFVIERRGTSTAKRIAG